MTVAKPTMEEALQKLTELIDKKLAAPPPPTADLDEEERNRRRRIDLAYRNLSLLMGRSPGADGIGKTLFAAVWTGKGEIELNELPEQVEFVDVIGPGLSKRLKVVRDSSGAKPPLLESDADVVPKQVIDSLTGLDSAGTVIALGPRLAP